MVLLMPLAVPLQGVLCHPCHRCRSFPGGCCGLKLRSLWVQAQRATRPRLSQPVYVQRTPLHVLSQQRCRAPRGKIVLGRTHKTLIPFGGTLRSQEAVKQRLCSLPTRCLATFAGHIQSDRWLVLCIVEQCNLKGRCYSKTLFLQFSSQGFQNLATEISFLVDSKTVIRFCVASLLLKLLYMQQQNKGIFTLAFLTSKLLCRCLCNSLLCLS